MADLNLVIPAKEPTRAKSRLSSLLTPQQRTELYLTLFVETLQRVIDADIDANILVVTDSVTIANVAKEKGVSTLFEDSSEGEAAAVEKAAGWSVSQGFSRQLVIPGDLAELAAADLVRAVTYPLPNPGLLLCPAVGANGTNAILTSPPDVISFWFGDRSFERYQETAAKMSVPVTILRLESLVLDLDTPDDLFVFLSGTGPHPARDLLNQWNIIPAVGPSEKESSW